MHTRLYALLLATFITGFSAQAKIWRVNNNGSGTLPLIAADFTTLQAAHDAAAVGDTIHLEQSSTTYGNCIFTKRLVVIGAGYFLALNPKTQVNRDYPSIVTTLTLTNAGCAGTMIMGLTQLAGSIWTVGANNVTIARCRLIYSANPRIYLGSGGATNSDGINLLQNYMEGSTGYNSVQATPGTTGNITNLNITGNFFGGVYGISLGTNASGIFKNNTVVTTYYPITLANFYIANNMTHSTSGYNNAIDNSTVEYNMGTIASHFVSPTGAGNTIGAGNQTVTYANWLLLGGASTDGAYQLTASSPAKGAGKLGDDMGMFGSAVPYKLSGIASVPNVYAMSIAPIAPGASSISVTVSAKSNN